jgi:hypothetical protein
MTATAPAPSQLPSLALAQVMREQRRTVIEESR